MSGEDGRFAFRNLPFGPYVMRAHLQGYLPPRARIIQVNRPSLTVSSIALTRQSDAADEPEVLAAGIGPELGAPSVGGDDADAHDHGEVAWRLRHLKRSVLKDTATGLLDYAGDTLLGDSLTGLGRAVGTPARLASSLVADVPWSGHLDLLTSTSFDRPQDLFSGDAWLPRGVAFLSLEAPTASGHWDVRGAITQGDLSSWILAGSYRRAPAAHRYEAGLSYGVQHYLHGAADPRGAVPDASRTVGGVYGYDEWTVTPRVAVGYGAKYARYDYLADGGLLSPRASLTLTPTGNERLKIRAAVSRRAIAPGAEEFMPPSSGLWLPPERTFSTVSPRRGFTPERVDRVELAAERAWAGDVVLGLRAFRQEVDDQLVTIFGVASPGVSGGVGHYYVATAGDLEARGWGVSLSRTVAERLRASIDYTQVESTWIGDTPDAIALAVVAPAIRRDERERFHDVTTTVDATLPLTATRLFVVYKLNSRLADGVALIPQTGARFDVQLNQALPFLGRAGGQWEMLVALRSLFRDELVDASVYDELLVVRPPKRVVGGVTVRF
ncbi:MAG: TonB-dependent receptor [Acidobacteria bacterium]|nr:TonB-dependent receptor [Acidobacteriota bacterium]